jgi:hypothetical protein
MDKPVATTAVVTGTSVDLDVLISPELQRTLNAMAHGQHCYLKRSSSCSLESFVLEVMQSEDKLVVGMMDQLKDIKFFTEALASSDQMKALVKFLQSVTKDPAVLEMATELAGLPLNDVLQGGILFWINSTFACD